MNDETLIWKEKGERKQLWKGPIFSIYQVNRINPEGQERPMVVCKAPDWVTIIPEIEGEGTREFLLVRQFRHGRGAMSCEFPAGVVDPGETAGDAAVRELREETGFTASEMIEIGTINPNPAFMENKSTTFLARGLQKTHELELDDNEFLEWKLENFSEVSARIGRGEYSSAIMVQGWYWYLKYMEMV